MSRTRYYVLAMVCTTGLACGTDTRESAKPCFGVEQQAVLGKLGDSVSVSSGRMNVAPLRDHGWAVLDLAAEQVILYSIDGSLVGPLLRGGAGPGEVLSPHALAVDARDSVWVSDRAGRLLVLGPDGTLGRTVPGIRNRVHGFTLDGKPFGILVKGVEADTTVPYAQVWTRAGEQSNSIGPGNAPRWANGRSVDVTLPPVWIKSDSVGFSAMMAGSEGKIQRWLEGEVTPWIDAAAGWHLLEPTGEITPERIRVVGITGRRNDGLWALARIYGLDLTQEAALIENGGLHASATADHQDGAGLLLHADDSGEIVDVLFLTQYPGSFIDVDHYYTVGEDVTGLITVGIWRITRECR